MKILLLQDRLRSGGTERQAVLLANAFAAAGHAATLLTFRPGGPLAHTVASNVSRNALQRVDLGLDWFAPGLLRTACRLAPDVVLCLGRMANCYAGAVQNAASGAAVVGTMRTGRSLPWLFRRSLHRVRHIVANSREARDTLVSRYRIPGGKISVIYNSLVFSAAHSTAADNNVHPLRETLRARHGASAETTVLLCVAMFRPEKNQRELIEIAATLPRDRDWQLWLAGDGPALPGCRQLASARGLADRVRFLGFQRDPTALYAAADVAVHASWSEALSNFLIEAQARGLPAVAFDAQGIRECFIPDRTGWAIARGGRDEFRAAILRLIALPPADRAAISAAAAAYARQTFDRQRQVDAYLNLFARLAPARR